MAKQPAKARDISLVKGQDVFITRSNGQTKKMFVVGERLASGSFGCVHKAKSWPDNVDVAIKCELSNTKYPQLDLEHRFYSQIYENKRGEVEGIPEFHRYGDKVKLSYEILGKSSNTQYFDTFNILVLEELGPSLQSFIDSNRTRNNNEGLSFSAIYHLSQQMFNVMEIVHAKNIIHRDIKPGNFVMGRKKSDQVHLLDFGLAKVFKKGNKMMERQKNKAPLGTRKYMSPYVMGKDTPMMRDDLISVCYVLSELVRFCLPWSGIVAKNAHARSNEMIEMKKFHTGEKLFEENPEFKELGMILDYCLDLEWKAFPDYRKIQDLIDDMLKRDLSTNCAYRWDGWSQFTQ